MTNHHEEFFKPGLSVTSINEFFRSPAHFWRTSSYNPDKVKKEATDAMIFGRLIHNMILTPELVAKEFVVQPVAPKDALITADDMKKFLTVWSPKDAEGKEVKFLSLAKPKLIELVQEVSKTVPVIIWEVEQKKFFDAVGKRTVVSVEDMKLAEDMRDAMFDNKAVKALIGNGASEEPVTWYREPSDADGLMCKCKLDYLRSGLIIEYKTTTDTREDELRKTMANFGYHRQMAWEEEAATHAHGVRPKGSIMIFQDKDIHENIAIHPLSFEAMERGRAENDYAYGEIKRRLSLHRSGGYRPWASHEEKIMQPLELPRYYDFKQTIPQE